MKNAEYITSRQNEKVKEFASLKDAKGRNKTGLFLAEGIKLTEEALSCGCAEYLLINGDRLEDSAVKSALDKCPDGVIKYILAAPAFEKVSTESAPQGLIAVCGRPSGYSGHAPSADELHGKAAVALDGIRDPGNLGGIIRSAAAFGYDAVILGSCADLFNPKTVRSSMGALFKMSLYECADLPSALSELSRTRRILGAALSGDPLDLSKTELCRDDIPVIGNEGHGISDEVARVCTSFIKIPITDRAESLNAGVAAAVIMWEYSKLLCE